MAVSPLGKLATGSSMWFAVHAITNACTANEAYRLFLRVFLRSPASRNPLLIRRVRL